MQQIQVESGDHVVHFYRDDLDLAERVGAYLAPGLSRGEAAVLIATEPHLRAIRAQLEAADLDIGALVSAGRLIQLDAAGTLAQLKGETGIDPAAFARVVGEPIREAGRAGRAVRAYGEMVDLLWQDGDVGAAIELETLWNRLLDELSFSLFCAYHSQATAPPHHELALEHVCRLHTAVFGRSAPMASEPPVSRRFQPDADAPGLARRFLEETLRGWGRADARVEEARLMLSELVTNAVVHARTPLSVAISAADSTLRLAVHDEGPGIPTPRPVAVGADAGRGLQIISALSRSWGVESTPGGKTVWVEL